MEQLCRGSPHALRGCINDVHCMRHLLITRFNFTDADIQILTDDQAHSAGWPTRGNMLYQVSEASTASTQAVPDNSMQRKLF